MSATLETQNDKIELRTTKAQKRIIEQAARTEGVNVKAFIFSRILPEAQRIVGERSLFILDEQAWGKLDAALKRPAKANAPLKSLLARPSVLEKRAKPHGRSSKS